MNPTITGQGRERLQQLVAFVQVTGRYPARGSDDVSERTLAAWLQRRRREGADGTLAPAYRQGLAVLPGWQDWPRHKATVIGQEHELGVWLHTQRFRQRRGKLDSAKADALDAAPGWRTGRMRGRKSQPWMSK